MDVLNDIEKDIDGDWKDIYDKVEKEHEFEEIKDPVIPNFPSYEEFYKILLSCLNSVDPMSRLPVEFLHMAHRITQSRDMGKPPESFNEIWSFFCDPHRYNTVQRDCHCGVSYTAILKRSNNVVSSRMRFSNFNDEMVEWKEVSIKQKYVYCVECGSSLLSIATEEIVGLFKE